MKPVGTLRGDRVLLRALTNLAIQMYKTSLVNYPLVRGPT